MVGLDGDEGTVDGGEREARELVGDGGPRVVAERGRYLGSQQVERVLADPPDHGLYLPVAGRGLRGEDDQQPQEVRVALERADDGRHDPGQVLGRAPGPPGQVRQVGEEAAGAAFHDGEQDSVLGTEVVVDGAHRDAGFGHHAGERRGFVAVLGHHPLGGVQHQFPGLHAPAVGGHVGAHCHDPSIRELLELTLQFNYCNVHSSSRERGARCASPKMSTRKSRS